MSTAGASPGVVLANSAMGEGARTPKRFRALSAARAGDRPADPGPLAAV